MFGFDLIDKSQEQCIWSVSQWPYFFDLIPNILMLCYTCKLIPITLNGTCIYCLFVCFLSYNFLLWQEHFKKIFWLLPSIYNLHGILLWNKWNFISKLLHVSLNLSYLFIYSGKLKKILIMKLGSSTKCMVWHSLNNHYIFCIEIFGTWASFIFDFLLWHTKITTLSTKDIKICP